jgi:DNA-binding beta-propeller fold protein YncE
MPRIAVMLAAFGISASVSFAQPASSGPYRILRTAKVGGTGGFDYVFADAVGRRLYIPRSGQGARVTVFNLDTLEPVGEIPDTNARGATVDPKSGHGFSSSKPVAMWDTKTLAVLKTIDVQGNPDGILFDPFNQRVWVFSHSAPNATIIDARDGSVVGTLDLGGAPEQAVTDGNGHIYVAIEDKDNVAVVDTRALHVTAHYDISEKAKVPAGLAFDARNKILFVGCRNTPTMVIMTTEGRILAALPIGAGVDGAVFNPATMQTFSSQGDGTLTVIREKSPTSFEVAQTVPTKVGGKTLTLDSKTNQIYVIAAEYGPPPAPPPAGGRAGRGAMIPDSFSILVLGNKQ